MTSRKMIHLFISHPYSVASSVGYTLQICHFLSTCTAATLAQVIITSHLDYSSSLLIGLFAFTLTSLRCVFNTVARRILLKHKRDRVTSLLKTLHYLLTSVRVKRAYNHNHTL